MSNFRSVLIIVFLCIAVILISGILLPKYLSTQILELRKELDSQSSNSKYSLQANLVPDVEKPNQSKSYDSISSRNADQFPSMLNSIVSPEKVKKRRKRQAVTDDEHFQWKFNFNLTGQKNHASQESSKIPSNTSHKEKHLDISIFTEGEAKKKSAFDEIQHSLRAAEYFFKYIFTAKNLTDETTNEFARSDLDLAELEDGSGEDTPARGREGKFFGLHNIFGFRISSSEKSVSTSTSMPKTESVFKQDDDLLMTQSPIGITENSQMSNLSDFQSQSLVSEALDVENKSSASESSLPGKTEDGECIDCDGVVETPVTSISVDKTNGDQSKIVTGSTEFTDEFLEMFCMSLVNNVGVSQHLSDSEELNFEPKLNITDEQQILKSPENPVDLLPTSEKELNPEFVAETSMSNDSSIFENEARQKKFLSLSSIFGFGSGRAAEDQDESNELTSEKFANVDLGNLPTLLDCENYFRKNLKMFPKPNLMDVSDSKIQFPDLANATISLDIVEKQQFVTSLKNENLDNSLETFGINSDVVTNSVSDEVIENDVSTLNVLNMLMHTEPNDLSGNTEIIITSTDVSEALQVTELERDGRFINLFGIGSGNGESRSLVNEDFDINRNEILGSGDMRSFEKVAIGKNIPGKNEDGECIDCDAVGIETPVTSKSIDQTKSDQSKIVTGSTEFTDEFLEMFCMSLVNVGVSQHLSDSEELNFEPKLNITDEQQILKSPENTVDLLPTSEKELNPEFVAETSMSNDSSISENEIRQKKFLSLSSFLGLGSGRAAEDQDESNELISEKFANIDLRNLPTLLDCENYFRNKNLKMLPKPGLIDISDSKIEFADLANATISLNLIEQQQFVTSLLKQNLDNSHQTFKTSDVVTKSVFDEMLENDASTMNEVPKEILMYPEPNEFSGNTEILITNTDVAEAPQVTEFGRDGKFINIFGFGSGNGESRSLETDDINTDRNEMLGSGDVRSFGTIGIGGDRNEFGSGDSRSLWDALLGANKNEFGSGDSRSLWNALLGTNKNEFGSGDSRSFNGATSGIDVREFGSGDSRSFNGATSGIDVREFGSGDSRSFNGATSGIDVREFGSGDSRSFNGATSGIDVREFGSGDSRSFNGATSGIDVREFGSGDSRSFNGATSGIDVREFGSGDSRSFNGATSRIDVKEFGSGDSFKETSDFITETYDSRSISSNEQLFEGTLESAGSGDERGLPENLEVHQSENKCDNCSFEVATNESETDPSDYGQNCQECNPGNFSEMNRNSSTLNFEDSKQDVPIEELVDTNQVTASVNLKTNSNAESTVGPSNEENASDRQNGAEVFQERATEINSKRILVPIFLTGSGEGGLFEDSREPINMLEEESTVKSQIFLFRKARLDDSPQNISEVSDESSFKQSEKMHTVSGDTTTEKTTSQVLPSRRGRVEDTTDEHCDDCDYDYEDFIENYRKKQSSLNKDSKFEKRKNAQPEGNVSLSNENFTVAASPDVIRSNISVFPDLTKVSLIQTRPCTAARECNGTLNERCITINSSRVCGCSKGYARNKETNKCIVMKIVETSIKLPSESFEDDLKNPFSPGFQKKRKSTIELVMLLLQNDPDLLRVLSEIGVEFSSGSLVVKLNLVFATENKSQEQLIKHVEDDFQIALRNETLMNISSLDVREASLVSVNGEIDYCKSNDLNYCSENAYCVPNPALPSSYTCHCKEHYRDASFDSSHVGETCIAKCPKDYCGAYGHCELLENDERICLCTGLYFGRRCEVPGLYVLIALAFVGFVSITMLFLVICKRREMQISFKTFFFAKRCSRFSYRQSQAHGTGENGIQSHMNGKVSDAIALEENIGTMKFVSISTPIPHPAIKITRPTITESGSSYDFDSTFDSTPSAPKAENSTV